MNVSSITKALVSSSNQVLHAVADGEIRQIITAHSFDGQLLPIFIAVVRDTTDGDLPNIRRIVEEHGMGVTVIIRMGAEPLEEQVQRWTKQLNEIVDAHQRLLVEHQALRNKLAELEGR